MPLSSRVVYNHNCTPEDDRMKWMRVQEVFKQHFEREDATRKAAKQKRDSST